MPEGHALCMHTNGTRTAPSRSPAPSSELCSNLDTREQLTYLKHRHSQLTYLKSPLAIDVSQTSPLARKEKHAAAPEHFRAPTQRIQSKQSLG
eukprot:1760758-Pleurochrysis_carterae.AAC.2